MPGFQKGSSITVSATLIARPPPKKKENAREVPARFHHVPARVRQDQAKFQQSSNDFPARFQQGSSKVPASRAPARFEQSSSTAPARFRQDLSDFPARFLQVQQSASKVAPRSLGPAEFLAGFRGASSKCLGFPEHAGTAPAKRLKSKRMAVGQLGTVKHSTKVQRIFILSVLPPSAL